MLMVADVREPIQQVGYSLRDIDEAMLVVH
jgi:hypothetical protein